MNTYAVIFAVFLATAQAMPQGWSAPSSPDVEIDVLLVSTGGAIAQGAAESSQATQIAVEGNPGTIDSLTGTYAGVEQHISQDQIAYINTNDNSAATVLISTVDNVAEALDYAVINAEGTSAYVSNAGSDSASGAGAIYNQGQSSNVISSRKH